MIYTNHLTFVFPVNSTGRIEDIRATAASSSATEKNKRISTKTADTLIKLKAQGPPTVAIDRRVHFTVRFGASGRTLILFQSKDIRLSDALSTIAKTYTFEAFGKPVAIDGMSLCVSSEQYPDWFNVHWDRRRALGDVLVEFDEILIDIIATTAVVKRQTEIESLSVSTDCASTSSPSVDPAVTFIKDQRVLYIKSSADAPVPATIIGVHHDDFPNIYYTVVLIYHRINRYFFLNYALNH